MWSLKHYVFDFPWVICYRRYNTNIVIEVNLWGQGIYQKDPVCHLLVYPPIHKTVHHVILTISKFPLLADYQ